ncbi:MAG: DNA polymerase III subunit beta [Pirellulaceae bacterium]|nr:DNA polymerase III subunit beta [Pirellulaceae bacterium]
MKIACDREKMASAFSLASVVANVRSPKEILQNVKIEVANDMVTLMASDKETGIRIGVEGVDILSPGKALLNVARVGQILKESSDEKLEFDCNDSRIRIQGQHSEFNLPSANPDEYPTVTGFEEEKYHEIPARLFKEMVRRTSFTTDPDSTRFALGGVLLELSGDSVIAVGTDGRRLARMEGVGKSVGGHETIGNNAIVPIRSLTLMERTISDQDELVHVTCRTNDIQIRSNRCVVYSRLVEGRFPNWRQVIPHRDDSIKINLSVGPFFNVLRQAAIVADQESRGLDFDFGGGTLLLSAKTANYGQSRVEMPIDYDGELISMKMDHRFIADFLRVLEPDMKLTLDIVNATSPALLTTDDGYAYVIMPMAVDK